LGATLNYKGCFGGLEKKLKEELGPRSLEADTVGYLVEHLEGEKSSDFLGQG